MKKGKLACVFSFIAGGLIAGGAVQRKMKKYLSSSEKRVDKFKGYYNTETQWLKNKNSQKRISDFFKGRENQKIGIYGMGNLGGLLYEDLKAENIETACFIEEYAEGLYVGIDEKKVIGIDKVSDENLDLIIVTPIFDFDRISNNLKNSDIHAEIISLDEIIFSLNENN